VSILLSSIETPAKPMIRQTSSTRLRGDTLSEDVLNSRTAQVFKKSARSIDERNGNLALGDKLIGTPKSTEKCAASGLQAQGNGADSGSTFRSPGYGSSPAKDNSNADDLSRGSLNVTPQPYCGNTNDNGQGLAHTASASQGNLAGQSLASDSQGQGDDPSHSNMPASECTNTDGSQSPGTADSLKSTSNSGQGVSCKGAELTSPPPTEISQAQNGNNCAGASGNPLNSQNKASSGAGRPSMEDSPSQNSNSGTSDGTAGAREGSISLCPAATRQDTDLLCPGRDASSNGNNNEQGNISKLPQSLPCNTGSKTAPRVSGPSISDTIPCTDTKSDSRGNGNDENRPTETLAENPNKSSLLNSVVQLTSNTGISTPCAASTPPPKLSNQGQGGGSSAGGTACGNTRDGKGAGTAISEIALWPKPTVTSATNQDGGQGSGRGTSGNTGNAQNHGTNAPCQGSTPNPKGNSLPNTSSGGAQGGSTVSGNSGEVAGNPSLGSSTGDGSSLDCGKAPEQKSPTKSSPNGRAGDGSKDQSFIKNGRPVSSTCGDGDGDGNGSGISIPPFIKSEPGSVVNGESRQENQSPGGADSKGTVNKDAAATQPKNIDASALTILLPTNEGTETKIVSLLGAKVGRIMGIAESSCPTTAQAGNTYRQSQSGSKANEIDVGSALILVNKPVAQFEPASPDRFTTFQRPANIRPQATGLVPAKVAINRAGSGLTSSLFGMLVVAGGISVLSCSV
jgi:hypothetical protein